MVRHLTQNQYADAYVARPTVDDRDPAELVSSAVTEVLDIAESWLGWDGRPVFADGNAWTPHKAIRRVADHLLDHLAELECRLANQPTIPDQWHGRMITTPADYAPFTETDLDEATSRLHRLAACYRARLATIDTELLDARPDPDTWTIREVLHHVSHITGYADQLTHSPDAPTRRQ